MGEVVTDVVTKIESVGADILTIGGAIIAIAAIVLGIRWIKAQFF